jgi:2-oxoglutarate ferredoxin oxidoreductase subunit beta
MLASLSTPGYITRQTLISPKYINRSKKAIKQAFINQLENRCFSLVELISTCPTNWGMTPLEALKWAEEKMLPYFKLGDYKTPEQE